MNARVCLALLLVGAPLRAQSGIHAVADSAAAAEIEVLEYQLIDLLDRRDLDAYASHLAEDYIRVNAAGQVDSKKSVLDRFRSDSDGNTGTSIPSDMHVRIYGDTALLSFVLTIERDGGIARRSRVIKVFVRQDGRWIMVHNQGTAIE
ncbi:MAG TPA: nuclear transport factor 2 family protein [Gemmatimonadota bacterium]|nr:nuclear transport factor 2 family protein [Gemmatimonadota bacterium]